MPQKYKTRFIFVGLQDCTMMIVQVRYIDDLKEQYFKNVQDSTAKWSLIWIN